MTEKDIVYLKENEVQHLKIGKGQYYYTICYGQYPKYYGSRRNRRSKWGR